MELKLAVLVCDSTIPSVEREEGTYERIFTTFLSSANEALGASYKLIIDGFDVYDDQYPEDISVYDGVILTGSNSDAFSDDDWVVNLTDYISGLVNSFKRTKVIGICFGHQLLARALGGIVERSPEKEMGSTAVSVVDKDLASKYFGCGGDTFRILEAHRDIVTTVPGTLTTVASTHKCKHQAFVKLIDGVVQCWSVQGHPEFTPSIMTKIAEADIEAEQPAQEVRDGWLKSAKEPHDGIELGKAILNLFR